MSDNLLIIEEHFYQAAKHVLPKNVRLLDNDGRIFHLMPCVDGVHYRDIFTAWIIERRYPSKKHLGSQLLISGRELFDQKPTLEWAKTKLAEALSRMVEFEDGGILPTNGVL
jgi:hypothetical protein